MHQVSPTTCGTREVDRGPDFWPDYKVDATRHWLPLWAERPPSMSTLTSTPLALESTKRPQGHVLTIAHEFSLQRYDFLPIL